YLDFLTDFINVSPSGGRIYAGGGWLYRDEPGSSLVFDSYLAGLGPHYIWYEYQDPQTGCVGKDSVFVHVVLKTVPNIPQERILQCGTGDPVILDAGVQADAYLWNTGETTRSISVNASGIYWVQISGAGKCVGGIDSVAVFFVPNQLPAPVLDKNLSEGDTEVKGSSELSPVGPTIVYVYVNGAEVGSSTVRNDRTWSVIVPPLNAGDVVAARIRYDSNCDGEVNENDPLSGADVYNLPLREIPNGFSPNGDGINDTFVIIRGILSKYPNNKLSIYNRWGTEVYFKEGYDNGWDAKDLPDGTYWYVLDLGDGSEVKKGFVTVMR
ncbi:MAG: gliding motility-associated C-terminal domain-containing protein, partial [Bacteroidia bacterium]|nr:gliding motility-associated C-terminal domain-containing protein [Bacteroidia bacterium]MDW8334837.1 gliding motility-associated C-terminal domain-containing protein [Bacteroidia bacterium]